MQINTPFPKTAHEAKQEPNTCHEIWVRCRIRVARRAHSRRDSLASSRTPAYMLIGASYLGIYRYVSTLLSYCNATRRTTSLETRPITIVGYLAYIAYIPSQGRQIDRPNIRAGMCRVYNKSRSEDNSFYLGY